MSGLRPSRRQIVQPNAGAAAGTPAAGLREEFDSYRAHNEKQNQSLKSAANIATIAAVLALIIGFVGGN